MSVADRPPTRPEGQHVADDFTGTTSEKTDKLIAAVVDIRASIRIFYWVAGIALPVLFAGMAYVNSSLITLTAKQERLSEKVEQFERRLSEKVEQFERRLDKLEVRYQETNDRLARLEERVGRIEERLNAVERQQRETNELLRQLLARQPGKP